MHIYFYKSCHFFEERPICHFFEERPICHFFEERPICHFFEERPICHFFEERPIWHFLKNGLVALFEERPSTDGFNDAWWTSIDAWWFWCWEPSIYKNRLLLSSVWCTMAHTHSSICACIKVTPSLDTTIYEMDEIRVYAGAVDVLFVLLSRLSPV